MTTIDFNYPTSDNKLYAKKARTRYKISPRDRPILYLSLGHPERGGQGIGKKHRIKEFYVDSDGRVFAEFIADDRSGHFYKYAIVGRWYSLQEEAIQDEDDSS